MKATTVFWQNLPQGTYFIEPIILPTDHYHVLERTTSGVKMYGTETPVILPENVKVIVVTEMPFGLLTGDVWFVRIANAQAASGFKVPEDILWKASPNIAEHVDIKKAGQREMIENKEGVINLGNAFSFENRTIATLNI